jgi:soluble lytic murein transglycosylase-like protein
MRFGALFLSSFLAMAAIASAGEFAVLSSGGRLHIDRHEASGDKVRFYMGDSVAEISAAKVVRFEADDYVPTPAALTPVAAAPAAATQATPSVERSSVELSPAEMADRAADKYGLPRWLVRSVMKNESGFSPHAVSPKGAVGLMQLMPGTAQILGANPADPAQNADAGARYLRDLLQKYDGGLWHALAAYNAGPGNVAKYGGVPPFAETVRYIERIERDRKKAEQQSTSPAPTPASVAPTEAASVRPLPIP